VILAYVVLSSKGSSDAPQAQLQDDLPHGPDPDPDAQLQDDLPDGPDPDDDMSNAYAKARRHIQRQVDYVLSSSSAVDEAKHESHDTRKIERVKLTGRALRKTVDLLETEFSSNAKPSRITVLYYHNTDRPTGVIKNYVRKATGMVEEWSSGLGCITSCLSAVWTVLTAIPTVLKFVCWICSCRSRPEKRSGIHKQTFAGPGRMKSCLQFIEGWNSDCIDLMHTWGIQVLVYREGSKVVQVLQHPKAVTVKRLRDEHHKPAIDENDRFVSELDGAIVLPSPEQIVEDGKGCCGLFSCC